MVEDDEPILEKAIGYMWFQLLLGENVVFFSTSSYFGLPCRTVIEWYPGKCLTQKILKKKPRKSGSKNAKPITKTEDCPSFFNFFNPPQIPEDDDDDIDEDAVSLASFKIPVKLNDLLASLLSLWVNFLFYLIHVLAGWRTPESNGTGLWHWVILCYLFSLGDGF